LEHIRERGMIKRFLSIVILSILVFLVHFQARSSGAEEPQQNPPAGILYERYDEPEGVEYSRLLPPLPEGMWYWTRYKGTGNVDATDDVEEVVLVTVQDNGATDYEYEKAFILVCKIENHMPELKYSLPIYDRTETDAYQCPPSVFRKGRGHAPNHGEFELVDLNKDGVLDVFIKLWYSGGSYAPFYVSIASFINERFDRIFTVSAGPGDEFEVKYVDIDRDGVYEIQIPNEIFIKGIEHSASPAWVSLYAWNDKDYVSYDAKFYSTDTSVLISFLERYVRQLRRRSDRYFEDYEFYLGLIYYYRGDLDLYKSHSYLSRIVKKAKNENYLKEARVILKRLAETDNPAFAPREQ